MSSKEEKARQYSNKKVEEKGLYPLCSLYVQRRLSTFDAYELEDAVEFGWDAATKKAAFWFADRYQSNGSYLNADDLDDYYKEMGVKL